jgi:hypothetical protein
MLSKEAMINRGICPTHEKIALVAKSGQDGYNQNGCEGAIEFMAEQLKNMA